MVQLYLSETAVSSREKGNSVKDLWMSASIFKQTHQALIGLIRTTLK